jgi:hypothetical protein
MIASASGVAHQLEHQLVAAEAGERGYAFVAEREGVVVGSALLSGDPVFPGSVSTLVSVAKPARASGVGSALADLLDVRLAQQALPASCRLRDDLFEGRRFAERRGFTLRGHSVGWIIDLAGQDGTLETAAHEAATAAGVRIRRADLPREIDTVLDCAARCLPGLPAGQQDVDPQGARDAIPRDAVVLLAQSDEPSAGGAEPVALGVTIVEPRTADDAWYTQPRRSCTPVAPVRVPC